jgi:hypothetical protein
MVKHQRSIVVDLWEKTSLKFWDVRIHPKVMLHINFGDLFLSKNQLCNNASHGGMVHDEAIVRTWNA